MPRHAKGELFAVLRRSSASRQLPQGQLPSQFHVCWWGPWRSKIRKLNPPFVRRSWRSVAWSLLCPRHHRALAILDNKDRVVHSGRSIGAYFQYPFARRNDIIVGSLETSPELRDRGLATHAVQHIIRTLAEETPIGDVWYVAREDNAASLRVAGKTGFDLAGYARRGLLGRYRFVAQRSTAPPAKETERFDFTHITEGWDTAGNLEQRQMAYLRFHLASKLAKGGRYLEAGAGTGYGFDLVRGGTRAAVATDLMFENLRTAASRMGGAMLVQCDALALPFGSGCFDVVAALESIYYFADRSTFLWECARVLSTTGKLLLTYPNPRRPGFSPSPGSTSYPHPDSLRIEMEAAGFAVETYGAFPWKPQTPVAAALEIMRRILVTLRLMPSSLRGRARLKRLLYRDMSPLRVLDAAVDIDETLVPLTRPSNQIQEFKTIVVVATRAPGSDR